MSIFAVDLRTAWVVATFACASFAHAGTLAGTATFRERMALPPGATFEAVLEDVSRAGAPATELGRFGPEAASAPPFKFDIAYNDAAVAAGGRYNVRASVRHQGRLLFATDTHVPAFGGKPLTLTMTRVKDPATESGAPLRNTHWRLVALNGKPAQAFKDQRDPHIVLKGDETRVSGSSGCNNVMGGFELEGDRLRFMQMASTMMMCPEGMEQEGAFLKTLEKVARYRISGDALTLVDDKGKAVAKFRAVALR